MKPVTHAADDVAAASPRGDALAELYQGFAAAIAANPDMSIDELRQIVDHCGDVTAEPGRVAYNEVDVSGLDATWLVPETIKTSLTLLCLHGGGYVGGSMRSHRKMYGHFAKRLGARALVLNYGLAPENLHPGPVNDATAGFRWLLEKDGSSASDVAIIGDSAGGSLAVATMLCARQQALPLPSAAICLSPWFDPEGAGASFSTNAEFDKGVSKAKVQQMASLVAGPDGDLRDPLLRPLDSEHLRGLPPILLQVSDSETLLDDSRLFFDRAREAAVDVTLQVYPAMQHVFHLMAGAHAVADEAVTRACDWLQLKHGGPAGAAPRA